MKSKIVMNWWAIYLEPILDSEERFCVGVGYEESGGNIFYRQVLNKKVSEAWLSGRKTAIGNLAKYACEHAVKIIKEKTCSENFEMAPGVYLGRKRVVEGYEINEMHERVLRKISFFSHLENRQKNAVVADYEQGFSESVQESLVNRSSRLVGFFNRQLRLPSAVKTFDFADSAGGLAANFYVFQKNSRIYKADVSCLELSMIKANYINVSLITMVDYNYKSKSKRLMSYREVEGVARHLGVSFKVVESADEAASYIVENAA